MKHLLISGIFWILSGFLTTDLSADSQNLPPLEAKRDQLMEMRFSTSLKALREADDKKTTLMLRTMSKAYIAGMEKLKPAYEQWYRGLSAEERIKLVKSLNSKKWIPIMQEIQFDKLIFDRFASNPALKREYDHIQFLCDRAAEISVAGK